VCVCVCVCAWRMYARVCVCVCGIAAGTLIIYVCLCAAVFVSLRSVNSVICVYVVGVVTVCVWQHNHPTARLCACISRFVHACV